MEVINFKTVHEIGQMVYVTDDGAIIRCEITGVLFLKSSYQYKVIGENDRRVLYCNERDVFDTVEQAIKRLTLKYSETLAKKYNADHAKI